MSSPNSIRRTTTSHQTDDATNVDLIPSTPFPVASQPSTLTSSVEQADGDEVSGPTHSRPIESVTYIDPVRESHELVTPIRPLKPFNPLYVVVEDSTTSLHHHPHVHYIFSDDDQEPLTDAILSKLSTTSDQYHELHQLDNIRNAPPQQTPSNNRLLIVDLNATGQKVVSAQSLDRDWQIVQTRVSAAPTFDGADVGSCEDGERLMLQINGVERRPNGADGSTESVFADASTINDEELMARIEELAARFGENQMMLQKIIADS